MLTPVVGAVVLGGGGGDEGGAGSSHARERQRHAASPGLEMHGGPGLGREAGQEEARRRAREANPGPGLGRVSFISRLRSVFFLS